MLGDRIISAKFIVILKKWFDTLSPLVWTRSGGFHQRTLQWASKGDGYESWWEFIQMQRSWEERQQWLTGVLAYTSLFPWRTKEDLKGWWSLWDLWALGAGVLHLRRMESSRILPTNKRWWPAGCTDICPQDRWSHPTSRSNPSRPTKILSLRESSD